MTIVIFGLLTGAVAIAGLFVRVIIELRELIKQNRER